MTQRNAARGEAFVVKKIKPKQEASETPESKDAILAPDEFITTTGHAFQWLQDHSRQVVTGIAVFFAAAAVVGATTVWQTHRNTAATWDMTSALKVYHRPVSAVPAAEDTPADEKPFATAKEKYTAAVAALSPVVERRGVHGAGAVAQLYLADSYAHLEDWDKAAAGFQAYLDSMGTSDDLRFLALEGLANAQEAKGDKKAAAETLTKMAEGDSKLHRDYALYNAGRLKLALGEKDQAKQLLQRVVKEFETSPLKPKADELLATVP